MSATDVQKYTIIAKLASRSPPVLSSLSPTLYGIRSKMREGRKSLVIPGWRLPGNHFRLPSSDWTCLNHSIVVQETGLLLSYGIAA